ncbi:SDR family oxidoreductase [soil metagenome]
MSNTSQPFAGQVALVTGASSGIGRATAEALAAGGADVALNYYSLPQDAEATAEKIRAMGRKALLFPVDISDQAAVEAMVSETVDKLGRLDVYISSAVYSDREPFTTADMAGFKKTIDISLYGAFYGLRAWANHLLKLKRRGSAVIVSSPHGTIAFPNCMAYNIAKAGLDMMMKSAARELMTHRIRVNGIYPGWTDTPGERKFTSDEEIAKQAAKQPWGRLATPEEIARGIVFLADPASDFITGTILHLEGGLFLPWWSSRGEGDF